MGHAEELAEFFNIDVERARTRLGLGFGYNHVAVAEDWRKVNPQTDAEILDWYKKTTTYCWELSAYHADPGFNYVGMCQGIAQHLIGAEKKRPLLLGDGIGGMTIDFTTRGLDPGYHDLAASVTSTFACFRLASRQMFQPIILSGDWRPPFDLITGNLFKDWAPDAVIAHDFFEHLVNVADWVKFVYDVLPSGGLFLAQNAFAIGDPDHGGSIPMHLARNNYYADGDPDAGGKAGWDVICEAVGFVATGQGNWRIKR